ncbi:MAG: DUF488 family protein [Bacteroidetes bacterium]|jgi:uncharacterized protein YeaO (DUF488 family)|nr:DUF488 family protein [Bacteroidota bacterium]
MNRIKIKRIYEKAEEDDGYRMFVDRLWARGLTKEKAAIDEWNKIIAPSGELRTWFGHKPEKFKQFSQLYTAELKSKPEELKRINSIAKKQNLTLLYAARNEKINHAIVLLDVLHQHHEQ